MPVSPSAGGGDFNDDGIDDIVIGANLADPNSAASGATYVVFGRSSAQWKDDHPIELSDLGASGVVIKGAAGEHSGKSVSAAGHFNDDLIDDIVIGADVAEPPNGPYAAGTTYVVFGSGNLGTSIESIDLSVLGNSGMGMVIYGETELGQSGYSVSTAGDVNNDGFDDIVIGAPLAGAGSSRRESVFHAERRYMPGRSEQDRTRDMRLWRSGLRYG